MTPFVHSQAGWLCQLCGQVVHYGRGDNFGRPAHAEKHVREGLLENRGRAGSRRGPQRFDYTAAGLALRERGRPCPCGRMTINDCAGECGFAAGTVKAAP